MVVSRRRRVSTMENANLSSALFAGTHFDRRRFAGDFARFRKGAPPPPAAAPHAAPPSPEKKRKRKSKSNATKNKKKKPGEGASFSSGKISLYGWLLLGVPVLVI